MQQPSIHNSQALDSLSVSTNGKFLLLIVRFLPFGPLRGPKAIIAEATHAQLGRALQQGLLALPEANRKLLLSPLRQPDHQNSFRAAAIAERAVLLSLQVGVDMGLEMGMRNAPTDAAYLADPLLA